MQMNLILFKLIKVCALSYTLTKVVQAKFSCTQLTSRTTAEEDPIREEMKALGFGRYSTIVK